MSVCVRKKERNVIDDFSNVERLYIESLHERVQECMHATNASDNQFRLLCQDEYYFKAKLDHIYM